MGSGDFARGSIDCRESFFSRRRGFDLSLSPLFGGWQMDGQVKRLDVLTFLEEKQVVAKYAALESQEAAAHDRIAISLQKRVWSGGQDAGKRRRSIDCFGV
jgi:hypothetical protein